MGIVRRRPKTYRERIVNLANNGAVAEALYRHLENDCHDIHFQQERGSSIWTVEATKFIKEDECI